MNKGTDKTKNSKPGETEKTFHNKDNATGDIESGDNQDERKREEDLKDSQGEKSTKDEGF